MGYTNFPNGITSFGLPIDGSGIPVTFGNTSNEGPGKRYYVNPTNGSDTNNGLSMDKPFKAIGKFNAVAVSNNHDVCVLSATSAHVQTDELTVTNNRLHFVGLDAVGRYYGQRSKMTMGLTTGSAIAIVKNTGVGVSFSNIKFDSSDTLGTSLYTFADGGEYTVLRNCEIYKSSLLTTAGAAELLCNGDSSFYLNCTIGSNANAVGGSSAERPNVLLNRATISGKVCRDSMFEDCIFWKKALHIDTRFVYGSGATDVERMLFFKKCLFFNTKLAAALPAKVIGFGSAQTEGYIIAKDCTSVNSTNFADSAQGVLVDGGAPSAATTAIAVVAS